MTGFVSMTSEKLQAWQESGGAITVFGTGLNDQFDEQPAAASGSGTGYINSCMRFEKRDGHSDPQLKAACGSGPNSPICNEPALEREAFSLAPSCFSPSEPQDLGAAARSSSNPPSCGFIE